jgi:hypothetical protein
MVVGYHALYLLNLAHAGLGTFIIGHGAMGVDIFFVISGFIIEYSTPVGSRDGVGFFVRRLIRIVPLYYLAMAVEMLVSEKDRNSGKLLDSLLFLPGQATNAPFFGYPLLGTGWTLSFEMLFYLLFAVATALAGKWRGLLLGTVLLGAVLAGQVSSPLPWSLSAYRQSGFSLGILNLATNPLLLEFGAGMLLAHLFRIEWTVPRWLAGTAAVAAATIFAGYLWWPNRAGAGLLSWGIPAVALVGASLLCERAWRIPRNPIISPLGDSSYALYLFHVPVLAVLDLQVAHLHRFGFAFVLVIAVAVGVSLAVHYGIEVPLLRKMRRWVAPRPAASPG